MSVSVTYIRVQATIVCEECAHEWEGVATDVRYEGTAPLVAEVANYVNDALLEEECPECAELAGDETDGL